MMGAARFFESGWVGFSRDPAIAEWAAKARPVAEDCLADPAHRARWLRCGGTWFAGVNVLPNDPSGAVPDRSVPPLGGAPIGFVARALGLSGIGWDRGQVSVCFPGYPRLGKASPRPPSASGTTATPRMSTGWRASTVAGGVSARRIVFERCRRVAVHARPGEAYLVHRLALHGVAPWTSAGGGRRMIVYFRPNPFPGRRPDWWLDRP